MIKLGEIALKGLNRKTFEDTLVKNIKWRLRGVGKFAVTRAQSTMYIEPKEDDIDFDEAADHLSNVFGIAAFTRALVTEKKLEAIKADAVEYMRDVLPYAKTFKVTAKRADKSFPLTSPQIQQELGGTLLDAYPHLKVDVHNPEVTVTIEIRVSAPLYSRQTNPRGRRYACRLVRKSNGADLRRNRQSCSGLYDGKAGVNPYAVHFVSPPYTSDRARQKVEDLCEIVSRYAGRIYFHCVPFTKIQEAIKTHCPEEFFTIIMRRLMMEIAIRISEENDLKALITGESLAQVASQTIGAIAATDDVCTMPVFRPLIGMDKNEIIEIARKIGTFETSILPFEDCCTVFTPKHPKTRPAVEQVRAAQAAFDFAPLVEEAVRETEVKTIAAL